MLETSIDFRNELDEGLRLLRSAQEYLSRPARMNSLPDAYARRLLNRVERLVQAERGVVATVIFLKSYQTLEEHRWIDEAMGNQYRP